MELKRLYTLLMVNNNYICDHGSFPYHPTGLFPGPTIEARPGDQIMLTVHNELSIETTAIHFHGIRQLGSNAMDGTPGLTQVCSVNTKSLRLLMGAQVCHPTWTIVPV